MGHGTLCRNDAQRQWHPKRPERLGRGSGETALYFGFGLERDNGEFGDGGDSEGVADFEDRRIVFNKVWIFS